jgi:hypothetical protein
MMTAVENDQALRPANLAARVATAFQCVVLLLVAAAFGLTVLVFYPGYSTADARYVYADALAWDFGDWQSPVMGVLWRFIDPLAPGSLSMFLLTAGLYWFAFGMLALIIARRSLWLGVLTPLAALAPPAFFFLGMIWRDVLFAVVWLLAAVLAFAANERYARVGRLLQGSALILIAFGVLLRPNAVIAAPFLAAYAIWPQRIDLKRTAVTFLPTFILFCVLVPTVYYGLLGAKRQNPLHSIFVFDLGGVTHFTGENQFPVTWSPEQTSQLASTCYDPVRWDSYWHVPPCPFVMQRLERPDDVIFGTDRLVSAWWQALTSQPWGYLQHRAAFAWQFLARSNLVLPVWDWLSPNAAYGHRQPFTYLVAVHDVLQPTLLFRPGLWVILAAGVGALAWRARSTAAGAFAVAVTVSAVVYVLSFVLLGVAADFRYAYWCVLATIAGAPAAMLTWRKRLRAAR